MRCVQPSSLDRVPTIVLRNKGCQLVPAGFERTVAIIFNSREEAHHGLFVV